MEQQWKELVSEGKEVASRANKDQWLLGELASQVHKEYGKNRLGEYAAAINMNATTLKQCRTTVAAWPDKKGRPGTFSVARSLNAHPNRFAIIAANPKLTRDEAALKMKEYRAAQPQKPSRKKQEKVIPLGPRRIEDEVQAGIDAWMERFRPFLEDAKRVQEGRRGLITKDEGSDITRCLHPDNSASSETRNKAFIVWKRINKLLMSEQDAPTAIPLPRRKRA